MTKFRVRRMTAVESPASKTRTRRSPSGMDGLTAALINKIDNIPAMTGHRQINCLCAESGTGRHNQSATAQAASKVHAVGITRCRAAQSLCAIACIGGQMTPWMNSASHQIGRAPSNQIDCQTVPSSTSGTSTNEKIGIASKFTHKPASGIL